MKNLPLLAGCRMPVTHIQIPSQRSITFPAVSGTDAHVKNRPKQYMQARWMSVQCQQDLLATFCTSNIQL
jgi:hypothetical protein